MLFYITITLTFISLIFTWFWNGIYAIEPSQKNNITLYIISLTILFIGIVKLITKIRNKIINIKIRKDTYDLNEGQLGKNLSEKYQTEVLSFSIKQILKSQYGTFWHSKVSIQLLLGSHSAVEKLAPSLTQEIWQECDG
ncbi:type VI secretion protein VasK, partial [Providencia sp. VP23HZSY-1]